MTSDPQLSSEFEGSGSEMALRSPASNKAMNRAARLLLSSEATAAEKAAAQDLVNRWRSSFSLPLRAIFQDMSRAVKAFDLDAICSRRLKRMESIMGKLERPEMENIQLTSLQDIGGCRAVVSDLSVIAQMIEGYRQPTMLSESYVGFDDYIWHPKIDGYRGLHLVVRPYFKSPEYSHWNGHKIEIQLRTQIQHAWATTVETVDLFSGERLKVGKGDPKWERFFALAGTVLAKAEEAPIVPNTPDDEHVLAEELAVLARELKAWYVMEGWAASVKGLREYKTVEAKHYTIAVVTLDLDSHAGIVNAYRNEDIDKANAEYAAREQKIREGKNSYTVLIALQKLEDLGKAYPNLYADTRMFWEMLFQFFRNFGQSGYLREIATF